MITCSQPFGALVKPFLGSSCLRYGAGEIHSTAGAGDLGRGGDREGKLVPALGDGTARESSGCGTDRSATPAVVN